ncbi:TIGR02680 family protein [Streptomyces aureocirculatus]|uniref:TIGR02680 family protein n=1 Tax=Streptomyces aureocirculatus TaxID=67275 RepID=UPI0004C6A6B4|nr:TIGR02680 family protein [Streptomyces aureocirculatus]
MKHDPAPPTRRYRLHRAGISNVWQYDEQEFAFGGGRLLLRGKNGAGKSKALEMLLPYLLDGDARALDATGTGRTTLTWLMLDGFDQTNRLGYLWVEFQREDEGDGDSDGAATDRCLTVGAAIRASKSTGRATPFFFTTPLRVGIDLHLAHAGHPLPVDRLREQVGAAHVLERAVDHRARVARELFGITDPARYRNLTHLLHRLRRPTIGDRIETGGLVSVLSETLPGLDEEIVDKVARNLDDLDAVRDDLGRLEKTDAALRHFLGGYRGYLHGVLRRRAARVGAELDTLTEYRKVAGEAAKSASDLRGEEQELRSLIEVLETERDAARTDLDALHASVGYRSLQELADKRGTAAALHGAAATAFKALRQAHATQQEAAGRLSDGAQRLGAELRDLGSVHRELCRQGERSGLEPAHLGTPVAPALSRIAAPVSSELSDPGGALHVVRHDEVLAINTDGCPAALGEWDTQLESAGPVIRARGRTVSELAGLIKQSHRSEQEAAEADAARERLEEQAEEAAQQVQGRKEETAGASSDYASAVRDWADRLADLAKVPLDAVYGLIGREESHSAPLADRMLPAHVPEAVTEAAQSALDPHLTALSDERDALGLNLRQLTAEADRLERERTAWERRQDPEPPCPPHRSAPRTPGTGAPLYRVVDFAAGVDPEAQRGLEAALEAAGLLDAWIRADGTVLDPDCRDTLLKPDAPAQGPTLAHVLRPVDALGCGVSTAQVARVLSAVALRTGAAEVAEHSAIGVDGSWKLGVAGGRHAKTAAEYVGAETRAATRRRKLAELGAQIDQLTVESQSVERRLTELTECRDFLTGTLRRPPRARELTDAWARTREAERTAQALTGKVAKAARAAEEARARAVGERRKAEATATAHDLPADETALDAVRIALDRVRVGAEQLRRSIRTVASGAESHRQDRDGYGRACDMRTGAQSDYTECAAALQAARRTIRTLEESIGASEQDILASEDEANRRLGAVARQLPGVQRDFSRTHDALVRADRDEQTHRDRLAAQETEVIAAGTALRKALTMPEVTRGAGLDGRQTPEDPASADVQGRIKALRGLTATVRDALDPERHDTSDTALLNRHNELRDQLSGGYDALLEEHDGTKICRLVDDHGPHDIAVVGERIAAQAADARQRLTEREREVFQRFLTGELGDNLSSQVIAAGALVAALNATLRTVRTSHGLGVELDWKLVDSVEADVRAAVDLLRSPSGLRTREQSEQLRDVLQRRIEDARRADPAAGYAAHLRTALDYRAWFTFTPWVVDDTAPGRRRKLSGRTGLSQGEQRVLSYLVLFAAAAAHFTTLAETAPHAPRLILLDDAFAKVDEPTHGRLGRILVDLDLDFVLTSERLIGNWPDVPSLHIYECLRDPHTRGVATLHYRWNGRQRRLMSV